MVTEILTPHKLVSFEKIDTTIYATADEACNAAANEIAALTIATAALYNKLGLAEYAAMEAFVRWKF